jgi:hypothetical protein
MLAPLLALCSLTLLPAARAELVERPPLGAPRVSLLLCDGAGDCQADAAWVQGLGIVDQEPLVLVDLLMELDAGGWVEGVDQRGRFEASLAAARVAAAEGRWRAVEAATGLALEALETWSGTVAPQVLFDLYWLQGAAQLHRGEDRGHEKSFRQAAALLAGEPPALPLEDALAERAFVEEQRKLAVAGRGTLLLGLIPADTEVWVDGRPLGPEDFELSLPPATHRVTALQRGGVSTWSAAVPVLGERTSRVVIDIPPSSSAAWVTTELERLFLTLQAPDDLEAMLRGLCQRFDLAQLRLLQVVQPPVARDEGSVSLGPASPTRPAAAEGEEVDHGDGVPSTYEAQLATDHSYREERHEAERERRLRVVFFDPVTGHLQADGGTAALVDGSRSRLRLGVDVGYQRMLEQHHLAGDLCLSLRAGPLWAEARAGAARAQIPYRLYPDWTDRWLYHVALGPGWRPRRGPLVPSVALLGEAWIPVSAGARLEIGGRACLTRGLCLGVEAHGAWSNQGLGLGGGLVIDQGL